MKRPSLRTNMPAPIATEAEEAAAMVEAISKRQDAPAPVEADERQPMTTSTIHLPMDLLDALRAAALRRASRRARADDKGRGGRPSVSEIVVELLERHRDEIEGLD
jgi:hypothetical protein